MTNGAYHGPERRQENHCEDHPDFKKHLESILEFISEMKGSVKVSGRIVVYGIPVLIGLTSWILLTIYNINGENQGLKARVSALEKNSHVHPQGVRYDASRNLSKM